MDSYRKISHQPEAHSAITCGHVGCFELLVDDPLEPLVKADPIVAGRERIVVTVMTELLAPPRFCLVSAPLRKVGETLALMLSKGIEGVLPRRRPFDVVNVFQAQQLVGINRVPVDIGRRGVLRVMTTPPLLQCLGVVVGEVGGLGDRAGTNIDRVDIAARGGKIR